MFLDHDSERSHRHRRKRGEKEERHEEASKREKSILKYVTLKRKGGGEEEDEKFSFERKEGINPSPLCLFYAWRRNIRENRGTRWKNEAEIWRIFDEKVCENVLTVPPYPIYSKNSSPSRNPFPLPSSSSRNKRKRIHGRT